MKANEAPERIYLQENTTTDCYSEFWPEWFEARAKDSDTVYVREDAFIEKACVKLKKLAYDNLMFQGRLHREEIIENFVGDFRKYMEGE
jgi:hypothetical protein